MYEFSVTINKAQIAEEVRNETHKFGKGRDNGQLTPQQVSNLQADDLAQDTSIVNTSLELSLERVVGELAKHLDGVGAGTSNDEVVLDFKMSHYYSPLSDSAVSTGIKAFVKTNTIYEYLKIVAPSDSTLYLRQAEQYLTIVKSTLNYKKWHNKSR